MVLKLILIAIILFLVIVAIKNKISVLILSAWLVEEDLPIPNKEDSERLLKYIVEQLFKIM